MIRGTQYLGFGLDLAAIKMTMRCEDVVDGYCLKYQYAKGVRVDIWKYGGISVTGTHTVEEAAKVATDMCERLQVYRIDAPKS